MKFKTTPLLGCGLLILLTCIMIVISGSYFLYYILILEIVTVLLMYVIITRNERKTWQSLRISEDEVVVGDEVKIEIKSNNTSMIPIAYAKIQSKLYNNHNEMVFPSENMFINPYQIINIRENFEIKTRGIFTKGVIHTEFSDPLRIFSRSRHIEKDIQLVVYPKVYDLNYFYLPSTGLLGTKKVSKSGHEDFSSLKKVRKYNPGDSFKRIHWKVSSKRGEMYVKEYEATSSTKMNLFVDAFNEHYIGDDNRVLEDKIVEIAASVSKYVLKENTDMTMVYHIDKLTQVESRDLSKFPTILKELVTFVAKGSVTLSELLNQETKRLESGSFVVLVTPTITDALVNTVLGLTRRRFEISLILVNDDEEEATEMLRAMGVHVYHISLEDDIKERLEAFS